MCAITDIFVENLSTVKENLLQKFTKLKYIF